MSQFHRRLYLSLLLFIIGFMPLAVGSFFALNKIVVEQRELVSKTFQQQSLAGRLRFLASIGSSLIPVYVLTGEEKLVQNLADRDLEFDELLKEFSAHKKTTATQNLLNEIETYSLRLRNFAETGIDLKRKKHSVEEVNLFFTTNTQPVSLKLNDALTRLLALEAEDLASAERHMSRTVTFVIGSLIALFCFALALGFLAVRLVTAVVGQQKTYDETQKILVEQEKQLAEARKEAVEIVAHDLKNPLGTIKMSLEMILDLLSDADPSLPSPIKNGLQMAYRSSESMERLIKDILDHAKIEAGGLKLDEKNCDLGEMVRDLVQRFAPHAVKKEIRLSVDVHGSLLLTQCDPGKMEQVLSNLIGNAIKFTPLEGNVHVEIFLREQDIIIEVRDTGPGLTEEQATHIFERFWQVRKTAAQGTGLGLAIAKAVVEAHDGRISVQSQRGVGSVFTVQVPIIKTETDNSERSLEYPTGRQAAERAPREGSAGTPS